MDFAFEKPAFVTKKTYVFVCVQYMSGVPLRHQRRRVWSIIGCWQIRLVVTQKNFHSVLFIAVYLLSRTVEQVFFPISHCNGYNLSFWPAQKNISFTAWTITLTYTGITSLRSTCIFRTVVDACCFLGFFLRGKNTCFIAASCTNSQIVIYLNMCYNIIILSYIEGELSL